MKTKVIKEYTNGEITVKWQADECIHATTCFKMLPEVFKPTERPWVKMDGASTKKIIKTVEACPTNALTWQYNDSTNNKRNIVMEKDKQEKKKITLFKNGPLHVPSDVDIIDGDGKTLKPNEDKYICRCGHSKNKPFCDGSHMTTGFKE